MNSEKIEKLWNWFYDNENRILDCIENDNTIDQPYIKEQLDNLILDIGLFSWEIGHGSNKPWFFTISPNGDKDLLEKSKTIIISAPELEKWQFHYCKPAMDWDRKFSIYDSFMDLQDIDASEWKFVAEKSGENKVEIILEAPNIKHLDGDTAMQAADLVVINEIGEEIKIRNISNIKILDELEANFKNRKEEIQNMEAIINEYFKEGLN